jgi:hypothetical protein
MLEEGEQIVFLPPSLAVQDDYERREARRTSPCLANRWLDVVPTRPLPRGMDSTVKLSTFECPVSPWPGRRKMIQPGFAGGVCAVYRVRCALCALPRSGEWNLRDL